MLINESCVNGLKANIIGNLKIERSKIKKKMNSLAAHLL